MREFRIIEFHIFTEAHDGHYLMFHNRALNWSRTMFPTRTNSDAWPEKEKFFIQSLEKNEDASCFVSDYYIHEQYELIYVSSQDWMYNGKSFHRLLNSHAVFPSRTDFIFLWTKRIIILGRTYFCPHTSRRCLFCNTMVKNTCARQWWSQTRTRRLFVCTVAETPKNYSH